MVGAALQLFLHPTRCTMARFIGLMIYRAVASSVSPALPIAQARPSWCRAPYDGLFGRASGNYTRAASDGTDLLREAILAYAGDGGAAYVNDQIVSLFPNSDSLTDSQVAELGSALVENWKP
jgi:hypothetical protein